MDFNSKMLNAGFSQAEINQHMQDKIKAFQDAGFTPNEIDKYAREKWGYSPVLNGNAQRDLDYLNTELTAPDAKTRERAMINSLVSSTKEQTQPKPVESVGEALSVGWGRSVAGLAFGFYDEDYEIAQDTPLYLKAAATLAQVPGDLFTYVLGAAPGAAAGALAGPAGVFAGASASAAFTTEYTRAILMDNVKNGRVDSFNRYAKSQANAILEGTKAAVAGAAGGKLAHTAHASARFAMPYVGVGANALKNTVAPVVDATTQVAVSSALNLRMPTMEDLALGAIEIFADRTVGGAYNQALAYQYQKTGETPKDLVEKSKSQPGTREDIQAGNLPKTLEAGGNYNRAYAVRVEGSERGLYAQEGAKGADRWVYTLENVPQGVRDNLNADESVTDTFEMEALMISEDANLLEIRSQHDPNMLLIYQQYLLLTDPGHADLDVIPESTSEMRTPALKNAKDLFIQMPEAFEKFLKSGVVEITQRGDARLGISDNTQVLGKIDGIKMGSGLLMFDTANIASLGKAQEAKPMNVLDELHNDINSNISIGEKKPYTDSLKNRKDFYTHHIDQLSPLNEGTTDGKNNASYLAARLYKGVNGIAKHWFEYGRSVFRPWRADNGRLGKDEGLGFIESLLTPNQRSLLRAGQKELSLSAMSPSVQKQQIEHATKNIENLKKHLQDPNYADKVNAADKAYNENLLKTWQEQNSSEHKSRMNKELEGLQNELANKDPSSPEAVKLKSSIYRLKNKMQQLPQEPTPKPEPKKLKSKEEINNALKKEIAHEEKRITEAETRIKELAQIYKDAGIPEGYDIAVTDTPGGVQGKSLKEILEGATNRFEKPTMDKELIDTYHALKSDLEEISSAHQEVTQEVRDSVKKAFEERNMTKEEFDVIDTRMRENKDAYSGKDPLSLFRTYLLAQRAVAMERLGINVGVKLDSAKRIVKNKAMQQRFEKHAQELYAYERDLIKYAADGGMISKDKMVHIFSKSQKYIPLQYIMEAHKNAVASDKQGIPDKDTTILDPFEAIIEQTVAVINSVEKNAVQKLIAADHGIDATRTVGTLQGLAIQQAKDIGVIPTDHVKLSYRENGEVVSVHVPSTIASVLKDMDPVSNRIASPLVKSLATVAGWRRAGLVLDVGFQVKNFFRDQFSAAVNSRHGYTAFVDWGKGLAHILSAKTKLPIFPNADKHFQDMLTAGGYNTALISQDRQLTQETYNSLVANNNVHNGVPFTKKGLDMVVSIMNPVNWGKGAYKALQGISETTDMATRMGEYVRAIENGATPQEAAYGARESTIDFQRMGASMKAINTMTLFLNATIQGTDRGVRRVKEDPVTAFNRITAGIVVPSIILALVRNDIMMDEEDPMAIALRNVPNWQKNMFWIIPTPAGIFRIPKPHEYGLPFANPVEALINHMYDKAPDKSYLNRLLEDEVLENIANSFMLTPGAIGSALTGAAFQPLTELTSNFSYFKNAPIVSETMEGLLPEARANRNTTDIARNISYLLNDTFPDVKSPMIQRIMSPIGIDHLVQSYGGTIGKKLLNLTSSLAYDKDYEVPEKSIEDLPIIGEFMLKFPNAGAESINKLYNRSAQYEQRQATVNRAMKSSNPQDREIAMRAAQDPRRGNFSQLRASISTIGKAINHIHYSTELSGAEKRARIDDMYLHMIKIAEAGLAQMDALDAYYYQLKNK